jgi:hypothetical protein
MHDFFRFVPQHHLAKIDKRMVQLHPWINHGARHQKQLVNGLGGNGEAPKTFLVPVHVVAGRGVFKNHFMPFSGQH